MVRFRSGWRPKRSVTKLARYGSLFEGNIHGFIILSRLFKYQITNCNTSPKLFNGQNVLRTPPPNKVLFPNPSKQTRNSRSVSINTSSHCEYLLRGHTDKRINNWPNHNKLAFVTSTILAIKTSIRVEAELAV